MVTHQPYMYDSDHRDSRSPKKEFDPKAVTRASWEVKPKKPKRNGPLVSFNQHPDYQGVITGRTYDVRRMSDTTLWLIRWTRYAQLGLRAVELIAGAGLLVLMILITNAPPLVAWILRIVPGVIIICSVYAILHLARPARARPPASSAAYQLFAGITDLAVLPFYAFGAASAHNDSGSWATIVGNSTLLPNFITAEYYGLISAAVLHVISLGISLYLCLMFKRIADMPPDMNPLESNLTSRGKHKRNKSSMASSYTSMSESTKRLSTPLENHHPSGAAYEDLSRPPSIPFMDTRSSPRSSFSSSKRDSRVDLPSRQYQITPGSSPRTSAVSSADQKRKSNGRSARGGSYVEVPRHDMDSPSSASPSRPGTAAISSQPKSASPTRVAKFTEAWYASESLINRTQKRQRAMNASERAAAERNKAYEALTQRYGDEESESDRENAMRPDVSDFEDNLRPNPLRLNPHRASTAQEAEGNASRQKTRHSQPVLLEMSSNQRSVSGSEDIADMRSSASPAPARRATLIEALGRVKGTARNFSIQRDDQFYSKPYGELRSGTPPIMYGSEKKERKVREGRQVSSGNDFDLGSASNLGYRRKASGRAAEEGMAGPPGRHPAYDLLDEE
ncbi:hypothetical protein GGR50DRAFT_653035 [Xylaria sp. CBS 124048]|nr:hypothetical protein GGR50DRAFT_653035 [Xylaria sp. CBS 124048]